MIQLKYNTQHLLQQNISTVMYNSNNLIAILIYEHKEKLICRNMNMINWNILWINRNAAIFHIDNGIKQ